MPSTLTDPLLLGGVAAGAAGLLMLAQARTQTRLLRRRLATGEGTIAVDPATGLFSAAATLPCVRAEANRSLRLDRALRVWVGAAADAHDLDVTGRELAFAMPAGCTGMRVDRRHVCVVTCTDATPADVAASLRWEQRTIEPGEHAGDTALAFLAQVRDA